jgi:tetratricopeptide (TPR) repeat protein
MKPMVRRLCRNGFEWLLWVAALIIVAGATTTFATTVQEKITAGDAALVRFDLDAAVRAYRSAVQLAPDDHEALWKLSRALVDQGTLAKDHRLQERLYIEAEQLARMAVRLSPEDSKGHLYLSVVMGKLALYEGGRRKVELSKETKAEAERAVALNPNEDVGYHVLAIWHREMVELNWLLRTFAELVYGKFPTASLESALANLRRAVDLAPDIIPHRVELGITLASAGRWAEAKTQLEQALRMPRTWATNEYYWELARRKLEDLSAQLNH